MPREPTAPSGSSVDDRRLLLGEPVEGASQLGPVVVEERVQHRPLIRTPRGRRVAHGVQRTASRAATKAASAMSRSSRVCAADSWVRMRALPRGTTGYENALTYTPRSTRSSAIR